MINYWPLAALQVGRFVYVGLFGLASLLAIVDYVWV
jgi:hypothetical protein